MFAMNWCRGSILSNGMKYFMEDRLSVSADKSRETHAVSPTSSSPNWDKTVSRSNLGFLIPKHLKDLGK